MQVLRDAPIKRKLLWITMATCGTALALAFTALFWFQSINFRESFANELASIAAVVAQNSAAPLAFDDRKSALEVLSAFKANPYITSAQVFGADGKLFARFGSDSEFDASSNSEQFTHVAFENGYAILRLPIALQDGLQGGLLVRAQFQAKYRKLLSVEAFVMTAVIGGTLVFILLLASAVHPIITRPIMALAVVARNVSEKGDYVSRAPEAGRDEVGLLTRTFNQMLDQIQSRDLRLHESQQRYEVAVKGSSDGLWDWNLLTKAVYFSPRWKSMLGYGDEELDNSLETFRSLLHPEDVEHVQAREDDYLQGRAATYEVEFRARHREGDYRWILSRAVALRDEQGQPVRFAGSHTDITERKLTEDEIRRAQQKFESLVNSINGMVWEADADTFALLFVSKQAEEMLGYPPRLWLADARFRENTLHPEDRNSTMAAYQRGTAEGKPYQLEFRMIAADGRTVWLRESVSLEMKDGRPLLLRGVAIDITEQKLAAENLSQIQRQLVEASRIAGMAEIATGVLHNVGNVLNSVNISSGLIVDGLRKSKTSKLAKASQLLIEHKDHVGEFLTNDPKGKQIPLFLDALAQELLKEQAALAAEAQYLQQNIEHIKQIVAMQQSYAKVSGALENIAPSDLFEDAQRMVSVALARHNVEVVRDFEPVSPVLVDRHLVLQILVNLLSNAKQALDVRPDGRILTLRISRGAGERVRLEVRDNGVGIPKENLTSIFNHGFTTKKTGHGFGLHSGANTARQMGGSLHVHSDGPGTGSTFVLELPVNPRAAQISPSPAVDPEPHLRHAAA